ncbi:hypothetical protein K505DRAFT_373498 [Melanomma pulvis-pyrius CBS 109.77]|uniref:Uncharacterized protein n=1 Tax=Melanomma pulvis-pyrius CBS 109.77 TaxID=1314802 RepID=A0A6A6XHP9_9PLEO|nr:hypothetical protein K505DRAFT_373498 [Melanomma pulvis-pyrius CBS 109.77]
MRFSLATILMATSLVAATPTPKERVVIMLESDATSKHHKASKAVSEICFLACFPSKPNCAEGWYAKEMGDCWTCCKDTGEEFLEAMLL